MTHDLRFAKIVMAIQPALTVTWLASFIPGGAAPRPPDPRRYAG
jgi:hypothetical protein